MVFFSRSAGCEIGKTFQSYQKLAKATLAIAVILRRISPKDLTYALFHWHTAYMHAIFLIETWRPVWSSHSHFAMCP